MSYSNILRLLTAALKDGEAVDLASGEILKILPKADDTGEINIGDGTNSIDVQWFGSSANNSVLFDVGNDIVTFDGVDLALDGPSRLQGFNALSPRFELKWVAGQRGKPSLNGDIQNAAEATRMIADPDFEVLGTNASSDDVAFYAEGGIKMETDGANHDQVILLPHLDANQSAWTQVTWGSDKQTKWQCHIKTGSAITNTVIWAGLKLTNTSVTATDDDQAFFRYQDGINSGKWQAINSIGGTDTSTDAVVTVAADTEYVLQISIDSSRIARFYIDGVLVKTSAALTNAKDLIPYIGIQGEGAAEAKHLYVFGQSISRVIG